MRLHEVLTLERRLIGLDLETTGTNPMTARIVEIGLEIMEPGQTVREYRSLVNPGIPIPPGATAVHHITDEMVNQPNVPRFSDMADRLLKGFTDADFAGYNVRFDLKILAAEFARHKRTWDYETARVIDGFRLWQVAEGRSLEDAIKYWLTPEDRDAGQAHSALYDIKHATRVIASQLMRVSTLPRDMASLHKLCSPGWFDAEGKLQWKDGLLVMGFGAHRDVCVQEVPKSYWQFILRKDFSAKVKQVASDALRGVFPEPPLDE